MNSAKEKASALKDAPVCAIRDWWKDRHRIPKQRGIYMFSDPRGRCMYVGSATGQGGLRDRLKHQVCPRRIGTPWTLSDRPGKTVPYGRNLLTHVIEDLSGKRFMEIDLGSEHGRDVLNRAVERIHELTVQWVEIPDENPKEVVRAEHCAICLYQPKYVGVPGSTKPAPIKTGTGHPPPPGPH